jgi:hypothetical protein
MAALRPASQELLKRARRGADDDPVALEELRDDLAGLSADELADIWRELAPVERNGGDDDVYRAVDRARRKLLLNVDQYRPMLLAEVEKSGGAAPPDASSDSLKALVEAFCSDGRGEEIKAAAAAIVRSRSFAYDIT